MKAPILMLAILLPLSRGPAKYSGGSGAAQDPYQIATAADLIALGETPGDYSKHFILTADLDLDPNLPGRKVFDRAVIAPTATRRFAGVFDGNGHTISHLTTIHGSCLFGHLAPAAQVKNLGIVDVSGGGLVGDNAGAVTRCYSTGRVAGGGGLVQTNRGAVTQCYAAVAVTEGRGGLVGTNDRGSITACYSSGPVTGYVDVGGLVGWNGGHIAASYSTGAVSGRSSVGGLVGISVEGLAVASLWDIQTSGQSGSDGGVGLTTAEMMDPNILGLNGFANDPNWVLDPGRDYPRLAWEGTAGGMIPEPDVRWLEGRGTAEDPYQLKTAEQLIFIGGKAPILWDKHFVLAADLDLDPALPGRRVFKQAVIPAFRGVFDGQGHVIFHLTMEGDPNLGRNVGGSNLGLFGFLWDEAEVRNIGVVDANITGSGHRVGGLVGTNGGSITASYSAGSASGSDCVGGLAGYNWGRVTQCYSTGTVNATGSDVGGLVGWNDGTVTHSYSIGSVTGTKDVGGLVGRNRGSVTACFWDVQASRQRTSAGGTGRTTAGMKTAKTFLDADWDFVGETVNATEDIWWILEGEDYPRLWWERVIGDSVVLVVDDFESYTDEEGNRIYETWIDGWTNGTGSEVGFAVYNFMEWPTHSGQGSMPFAYNNVDPPYYSEAYREWDVPQDWTTHDVNTLTLYVLGRISNDRDHLYVALEDATGRTHAVVHPDPNLVTGNEWTEWNIPLREFTGVNCTTVSRIYLGVGNREKPQPSGTGRIYIDDIGLTKRSS